MILINLVLKIFFYTIYHRLGMVRIFMGPKFDERRSQFNFNDQRRLMIEMDKFVVQCEEN